MNPGVSEFVGDLLAKANAAGREAAHRCDEWPVSGCATCATAEVTLDPVGRRIIVPCEACGAVRG